MSKKSKTPVSIFYAAQPWRCEHHAGNSEILAYVEASGAWESVATIRATSGMSAETMAEKIVEIINDNKDRESLMQQAAKTLQFILDEQKLNFSTEQEAERLIMTMQNSRS